MKRPYPCPSSSSIVYVVMLFTLLLLVLSGPAMAGTYSEGSGTSADPYQIATSADLIELSTTPGDWSADFIQTQDIAFDADETLVDWDGDGTADWDAEDQKGFSPIGNSTTNFTGNFDGQNHTIANLYILRDSTDGSGENIGLFGYADGSELKNIGLVNPVVTGFDKVGSLVGWLSSSSIDNCYAEGAGGEVIGYRFTGGLAGLNEGSITNAYTTVKATGTSDFLLMETRLGGLVGTNTGTITDCRAAGTVEGIAERYMGGLAGFNSGTITNSFFTGTVLASGNTNQAGGLVGVNAGTINTCHFTGNIQATNYVGGLVGVNRGNGEIINSYATGEVHGDNIVGGLVGQNGWETDTGTITGSFAAGNVKGSGRDVGNLVGRNGYQAPDETNHGTGTITNCHAIGDARANEPPGGLVGSNVASTITNSYAAGNVKPSVWSGLVNSGVGSQTITQSFWDTDTTGADNSNSGTGKTTAEMKQLGTFSGWTFDADNWAISDGNSRPYLAWQDVAVDNGYPDSIAATSVTFPQGNIHNNAGADTSIDYGYIYKQNTSPTWQDSTKIQLGTNTLVQNAGDLTIPETTIDSLTADTIYYARAYADDGNNIWYGQVVRFTTQALYTLTVTNGTGGGDYTAGTEVSIAADAPQAGHSFDAWTGDTGSVDDVSSASTILTMPAANIQVTAEFGLNQYTVTFRDHDSTTLKTETVAHGNSATAPAAPTRTGYTFTGWDTDFDNVGSDLTVTAQYEINTYTVTFRDHDGAALKTETVAHGGSATAPADPARTGYIFTGWDTAFDNVTSDLTVIAQYESNTYTVTFRDHDGAALKTETVAHGNSATAPADPIRTGYTFTGWDTAFDNVTSDLTVTAQYETNTYTVIFLDHNGGNLKTETVSHGDSATAPADPARSGYTFTGWDTAFDNVASDLTVIAQYIEKGDIDNDATLDLADAILALQISAGIDPGRIVYKTADVNGDERIGIEEAIYILRSIID